MGRDSEGTDEEAVRDRAVLPCVRGGWVLLQRTGQRMLPMPFSVGRATHAHDWGVNQSASSASLSHLAVRRVIQHEHIERLDKQPKLLLCRSFRLLVAAETARTLTQASNPSNRQQLGQRCWLPQDGEAAATLKGWWKQGERRVRKLVHPRTRRGWSRSQC